MVSIYPKKRFLTVLGLKPKISYVTKCLAKSHMKLFIRVRFIYYNQKINYLSGQIFDFFFVFSKNLKLTNLSTLTLNTKKIKNPRKKGYSFFESLNNHLLEIKKIFHRNNRYFFKKRLKNRKKWRILIKLKKNPIFESLANNK